MIRVFLCHASTDKPKVRKLYTYLREQGINAWLDEENLLPGQDWSIEIPKALEESDAIIVCLSKTSIDKEGYIQKEIRFALDKALEIPDGKIFLIPARLEECDVPRKLSAYQWVDLFKKKGYSKLMESLGMREQEILKIKSSTSNFPEDYQGVSQNNKQERFNIEVKEQKDYVDQNHDYVILDNLDLSFLPYIIESEVGRGHNASIYLGKHKILNTTAAIKFLRPSILSNPSRLDTVAKNIRIASNLDIPNFIRIYSLDVQPTLAAVTMEYFSEGSLRSWAGKQPRSIEEILVVLEQIAVVLDVLHSKTHDDGTPLLHQNLTPENILLTYDVSSKKCRAILTDLGLQPEYPEPLGKTQYSFYISPEQVEGLPVKDLDRNSDLYSLAVIAYEFLSGKRPFEFHDPIATAVARLVDLPPSPSEVNNNLPVEFDHVLLKALRKQPEQRYVTCGDFARALRQAYEANTLRRVREFINSAKKFLEEKDFTNAQKYLEEASAISPNDVRLLDAMKVFNQRKKIDGDYAEADHNWKEARRKSTEILELIPKFPDSHNLFLQLGLRKSNRNPIAWITEIVFGFIFAIPVAALLSYLIFLWIVR